MLGQAAGPVVSVTVAVCDWPDWSVQPRLIFWPGWYCCSTEAISGRGADRVAAHRGDLVAGDEARLGGRRAGHGARDRGAAA